MFVAVHASTLMPRALDLRASHPLLFFALLTSLLLLPLLAAGYHAIAKRFFDQAGFEHVALLTADGALEAAPAMGCADIILDLVSTGEGGVT
jgi:ATP phosphoribosyltransferase